MNPPYPLQVLSDAQVKRGDLSSPRPLAGVVSQQSFRQPVERQSVRWSSSESLLPLMEAGGLNVKADTEGTYKEGMQGQGSTMPVIGRGGGRRA